MGRTTWYLLWLSRAFIVYAGTRTPEKLFEIQSETIRPIKVRHYQYAKYRREHTGLLNELIYSSTMQGMA